LLNVGCIDDYRSLNKARILKFEKIANPDPDPDSKLWEQERSLSLKMWLQQPLVWSWTLGPRSYKDLVNSYYGIFAWCTVDWRAVWRSLTCVAIRCARWVYCCLYGFCNYACHSCKYGLVTKFDWCTAPKTPIKSQILSHFFLCRLNE